LTLEKKLSHLQAAAMTEAREKADAIMKSYSDILTQQFEEHKQEAMNQSKALIASETTNAKQTLNKTVARTQTELKKELGKRQIELKDKLFDQVSQLLNDYMKTENYISLLVSYMTQAISFADGQSLTIFINPSDQDKQQRLKEQTGVVVTISEEDFVGGIRAIIHERNVLIDRSFQSALEAEYKKFLFGGAPSGHE